MVWIAQLTDIHLDGSDEAYARFARVVGWLETIQPSLGAILITGDLVEDGAGSQEDYGLIRDALQPLAPTIAVPGNADNADAFDAVFGWDRNPGSPAGGGSWLVPVADGVWILPLDSSDCEENDWTLDPEPLAEAAEELETLPDDALVLVALHHPPIAVGHTLMDQMSLRDVTGLEALVRNERRILGVVVGHIHSTVFTTFAGKPLIVGPAVVSGIRLDAELTAPAAELTTLEQAPMVTMHLIEGRRLSSWVRVIV
ncbi:MAG: metallophosphoesterase [Thermomicrobiales bacterium]